MKVLLVRQSAPGAYPTFIDSDFQILSEAYETREIEFAGLKDVPRLLAEVYWADCTFSWFGKLHAFFAVLFSKAMRRRGIVVAGDDDVTNSVVAGRPYGLCAHPVKKWFAYTLFHFADLVIPISKFGLLEAINNAKAKPKRTKLIYHGFDSDRFRRMATVSRRPRTVITVAHINWENVERKGLRLFVESARLLEDVTFTIVGPALDASFQALQETSPPNVAFAGSLVGDDLVMALNRAAVYVQASEWESFGCSVAEAMLCECVPVVSRRGGLPEVVGEAGFYVDRLEFKELAAKIEEALRHSEMGRQARRRIVENFPLERRKLALLGAVERVLSGG